MAPVTLTLEQPSPKEFFTNNWAKLKCVITGQDEGTLNGIQIEWQAKGTKVNGTTEMPRPEGNQYSRTSWIQWDGRDTVTCSAVRIDVTLATKEMIVRRGDGRAPQVTVHVPSEGDIINSDEVTLVCLVSSPVLQDHYIAWSEGFGSSVKYVDGISFPPRKTKNGYIVADVYTTTKDKWNQGTMFYCNVWPAGSTGGMTPHGVSKMIDFSVECDKK